MKNYRYFFKLAGLAALLILLWPLAGKAAEGAPDVSQFGAGAIGEDNDVIAVRILPNPNHYSASRWYSNQGFSGSPQSLVVDGYDAVRDGRTVYVNAANVDTNNGTIYTNIYLISYNQNPDFKTVDVLGQIVKHWKFNSNLSAAGQCAISTIRCASSGDCVAGNDVCYTDEDCGQGIFCDNLRSKVARDVRRLGSLGEIRFALANFKNKNNKYPVLGAGTYIPLNSISVWPSWQSLFLPQLGAAQKLVDPINSLGACAGFDPITCWNEETRTFGDPQPNDSTLELPAGSYAYVYSGDATGSNFSLCASMETKALGYNTAEGQLEDFGCVLSGAAYIGSSNNSAPVLISTNLQGETDQAFNGSIRVLDPEGNPLQWSLNTGGTTWSGWKNNNVAGAPPILMDTTNPNQKKIYAQSAGAPGTYNMSLTVTDGRGGNLATVTPIVIRNNAPLIHSDDIQYYPSTVLPLSIRFSITDKHQPVSYTITKAQYSSGPFDLLSPANATFSGETSNRVGDTVYYTLNYSLLTIPQYSRDTNFVYVITGRDSYNNASTRQINILVKAEHPLLDFNCAKSVRAGYQYYCGLGWRTQGDHTITYSAIGPLPAGISLSGSTQVGEPPLEAKSIINRILTFLGLSQRATAATQSLFYALTGRPTVINPSFPIKIKAVNEFGAESIREFTLGINSYCGDGVRQQPNLEGRGGYYNDGHEDCDGTSGIILNRGKIGNSHSNLQYGCNTKVGTVVPFPVPSNKVFCGYLGGGPEDGGGYCGDGICQVKLVTASGSTIPWETGECLADCQCDAANQSPIAGQCVCNAGWYDCDASVPGCESNTECAACGPSQYRCGDQCYYRTNPENCGINSNKCSTLSGNCIASCSIGLYNCDGQYDCEAISCSCTAGYVWNNEVWPHGACEVENTGPCPIDGHLLCGTTCYNPATQQCCNIGSHLCGVNQVCCANSMCASSYVYCAVEEDPEGGEAN
ncbi:MAG: hypothetical protein Q8Q67_03450 [bacterium]|nr:hypothetical protein [bacterium]